MSEAMGGLAPDISFEPFVEHLARESGLTSLFACLDADAFWILRFMALRDKVEWCADEML